MCIFLCCILTCVTSKIVSTDIKLNHVYLLSFDFSIVVTHVCIFVEILATYVYSFMLHTYVCNF